MATAFEFGFVIEAIDKATATLRKVQTQMEKLGETTKATMSAAEASEKLEYVGTRMAVSAIAIGAPLYEAVKGYEELQEQINNVSVATGGLSEKQRTALEDFVKQQAVVTGFSTEALTKSVYQGVSGFLTLDQAMAVSAEAAKVARSTQGDVADTTKLMTTMLLNFGDKSKSPIENSTMLADKLTKVQSVGKWSSITDLTVAMGYAAPTARTFNISLDQTFGALSSLAAAGYDASRAGTGYNEIVDMLAKKQDKYGYALVRSASGGLDLYDTLLKLQEGLKKLDPIAQGQKLIAMFGPRAGAAIGLMFQHMQQFSEATAASAKSAGATDKAFAEFADHGTLGFARLHAAISNVMDSIGGALAPNIESAARSLTGLAVSIEHFATAHPTIVKLAVDFAAISTAVLAVGGSLALAGSALLGLVGFVHAVSELVGALRLVSTAFTAVKTAYTLLTTVRATGAITALFSPWLIVLAAIAIAIYEVYEHWDQLTALWNRFLASNFFMVLSATAGNAWSAIKTVASRIEAVLGFLLRNVADVGIAILGVLSGPFGTIAAGAYIVYEHWSGIKAFFLNIWSAVATYTIATFNSLLASVKTFFINLWSSAATSAMAGFAKLRDLTTTFFTTFMRDFYDWGTKLITELARGIKDAAELPLEGIKTLGALVMKHMPWKSPAETGPLQYLDRVHIMETIAETTKPQPLVAALQRAFAISLVASGITLPATATPTIPTVTPAFTTGRNAAINLTANRLAFPITPTAVPASVVTPVTTKPTTGQSNARNIVINLTYAPVINSSSSAVFEPRRHADQIVRLIKDHLIREERLRLE